jgi:hypothetical protein
MLLLTICAAGVAWWLGLYLLARDPHKPLLRRAGAGLLAYALALAVEGMRLSAELPISLALGRVGAFLIGVPTICWSGALLAMLPEASPQRERLNRIWRLGLLPVGLALLAAVALADEAPAPLVLALFGALALAMLVSLALLLQSRRLMPAGRPTRQIVGVIAAATLFFGLSVALLLLPLLPVSSFWLLLGIGFDLLLLELAVAWFDAFDEGQALGPDLARSLIGAALAALLFGGQVGLALLIQGAGQLALVALLFGSVAAAIAVQVLASPFQSLLDRLAFPATPGLRAARASLRETAEALPRIDVGHAPEALEEAEFTRLTRRALSHYGDLPRLASSPLTQMALIDGRLRARGAPDQPLERAAELRALLAEAVDRLRPRDGAAFGTSDAWRHYNALYFPYIVGLRPYSRRANGAPDDPAARQAHEWLAADVPERTLHNWQNAAARLVADDLRAQILAERR